MQLIFQCRFYLSLVTTVTWFRLLCPHIYDLHLFVFSYRSSFLFSISPCRSYHGRKGKTDFVRRRRWARYYKKQAYIVSNVFVQKVHSGPRVHLTFSVLVCVESPHRLGRQDRAECLTRSTTSVIFPLQTVNNLMLYYIVS